MIGAIVLPNYEYYDTAYRLLCTLSFTLYSVLCTAHCSLSFVLGTLYFVLCSLYSVLCTMDSVLCTLYPLLCTLYSVLLKPETCQLVHHYFGTWNGGVNGLVYT